jgi:hypothetical protein
MNIVCMYIYIHLDKIKRDRKNYILRLREYILIVSLNYSYTTLYTYTRILTYRCSSSIYIVLSSVSLVSTLYA